MNQELQHLRENPKTLAGLVIALSGLALSFILQNIDWLGFVCECPGFPHFVVRKIVRVIVNDTCMLLLIHCWFNDPAVTRIAWKVQLVDTLILLPVYLVLKLVIEGDSELSSPLLSQLHRVIVNPTLMILIIPAVYFQRLSRSNK